MVVAVEESGKSENVRDALPIKFSKKLLKYQLPSRECRNCDLLSFDSVPLPVLPVLWNMLQNCRLTGGVVLDEATEVQPSRIDIGACLIDG